MATTTFSADMEKFAKKLGKTLDQTHRGVVIKLFNSVIMDTPVLNGFLRGAWTISRGEPDTAPKMRRDPNGLITRAEVFFGAGKAGDKTFLTNSMPYAYRIEYEGWSHTKAPHGMVRKNVARIEAIISEAVNEAKR